MIEKLNECAIPHDWRNRTSRSLLSIYYGSHSFGSRDGFKFALGEEGGLMKSRGKAVLWALLPLLLLTPPLLWLGKRFENQLASEQRARFHDTLVMYGSDVQQSFRRIESKLISLELFVGEQMKAGKSLDNSQFNAYAEGLQASAKWIKAFQIVSNGIVTYSYPQKGNEAALGYNLLADPRSIIGADVIRASEQKQITITGPINLLQGGLGIIIRKPLTGFDDGSKRLVAIVLNTAPLLAEAGIVEQTNNEIQIAIRRKNGPVFFGPGDLFQKQPVLYEVLLSDGAWELGACPLNGWPQTLSTTGRFIYLAGASIISLIYLLVFTLARRQADLAETVMERTRALSIELAERKQAEELIRELDKDLKRHNEELEQRVAERTAELEVAKERAESADRVKSAFLATMSHELRTPLNSIIGFTGIMLQGLAGPLNAEQAKQLGMVQGSARHLLALINDVLDISKIEARELKVAIAPFNLRATIERSIATVRPLAESRNLSLRMEVSPEIGELVSDARRVEQILLNLLNNAIKFTEQGGVVLTADLEDEKVRVRITDTGIGIKAEDLAGLFRPFQQVVNGLSRSHEGTGLGLVICRRLAGLLGGEIRVESQPGKGSTFTVILPQKKMQPA